ncbi:polysaccharide biosynthesis protein [Ktedonobacter sp. SOSP1-85]|uniref:oligosaccharide flippase family protein n=1 Tax=Ktedonobacter sp. SOSP1-85 TaxID=2778367 RepID=UPI00191604B9|nr:oligosaccharide flippase family protein [Ktedonobacter sp. SOSP1-85]GHO75958.1 polysaccharide biosynthesis protein [Ktedonobacter sp. SOSP1-85]
MDKLRKVVGSTAISLLGQAITWTSTFLLTIAYGRFLGAFKFGELYFALSFVMLIGFPLEFGFNQQITRDVAQDHSKALSYLSNSLLLKSLFWLILYAFALLFCHLVGYDDEQSKLIMICGISLLSGSTSNTFAALHYAFGNVLFPVIGTILEKGLAALIGYLVLKTGGTVQTMALVLLVSSAVNALWQALCYYRKAGLRFRFDWATSRSLLRTSIPFIVSGAIGVIYYRIDTLFLQFFTNTTVVGWYGAGYRLFDTLVFLPSLIINPIMAPIYANLTLVSQEQLKIAIAKSFNFLLFFVLPITTALIVAAPTIIGVLYHNPDFQHTIPALQALAPGLVFLYINTVIVSVIISTRQEKKITITATIALVFNLALNFVLIPRFLHVGAALTTTLTEFLLLCINIRYIPRQAFSFESLVVASKAFLASVIMGVVLWLLRFQTIYLLLPAGACTYLAVALLFRTIPPEDLRMLQMAIRHKSRSAPAAEELLTESIAVETLVTEFDEATLPRLRAIQLPTTSKEETTPSRRLQRKRRNESRLAGGEIV